MALPVRDYLYLDTRRLQDYMASIDPGAVQELKTINRREESPDSSLPEFGNERLENREEKTLEQRLTVSDRNQFSR